MEIAKVGNIIWHNEPFHYTIAFVLGVAIIIELYTFLQYWRSECGTTEAGIKFLNNLKKGKNVKPSEKDSPWLKDHLGTDDSSKFRQQDGNFILIKYPSVLAHPIPRSSLRFVTTLCTAIGLLGTFYGIQLGLQGINLSTDDPKQLMTASKELLGGMKTAFSTSMMGLGSGSLFLLVLFVFDSLRQKRRDSLRQKLKAIATLKPADNANHEVAEALSLVAKNLTGLKQLNAEGIGQAVGRSIAEQFAGLNQLSPQGIGKAVGEQVQTAILPALRAIFKEQQQLRQLQENQGQRVLEELIKDLRIQVLEPIADRLDKSAELTQQASNAVLTLHRELGGISQSLASSILTIENFQKETLVELQGFANNLGDTLNQFKTDTKGVLQQTADEINRAVDQSIQGMTAQRSAFKESAVEAAATFRGIREELQTALQERAIVEQQMLQATQTGIIQILTEANRTFHEQTNTLKTVGDQASGLMNGAKENLLGTLENIDATLTSTRQTVEDDLTRFRQEYQENLQIFFQKQNYLLEGTLGKQQEGLSGVVKNLDQVFREEFERRSKLTQEVDVSMTKIQVSVEQINRLVSAAGLNDAQRLMQLENLARGIGQQVQIVDNSYRNLNQKFDQSLQSWQGHLEGSMQRTVDLQESFFQKADTSMARVCGDLLKTAEVLVAANKKY
ncbi:MAG: MotA/TolQ/ExbB proton channel family protein [Nostoc sp.]|uniref:MotA/TolQ/ExbB proton channel family protein n=1 Tax=Nostoc sp. TaxID=1180 RepID=UPI002FFBE1B3